MRNALQELLRRIILKRSRRRILLRKISSAESFSSAPQENVPEDYFP